MSVPATAGVLSITDARIRCAAVLEPATSADPDVLVELADAVSPPVLMVGWDDPWLEPAGNCRFHARLTVWCIAGRLEPGAGVATLEQLVSHVIDRMKADPYSWGNPTVSAPRAMPFGAPPNAITYLAARVGYQVNVQTEPGA